jgi:Arc/MetJ-type ribon-helix-helix transcriptional regulator
MKDDPDKIIGKTVRLPASVWAEVDDYRFSNRINKQTEAIRRLIELALEVEMLDEARHAVLAEAGHQPP